MNTFREYDTRRPCAASRFAAAHAISSSSGVDSKSWIMPGLLLAGGGGSCAIVGADATQAGGTNADRMQRPDQWPPDRSGQPGADRDGSPASRLPSRSAPGCPDRSGGHWSGRCIRSAFVPPACVASAPTIAHDPPPPARSKPGMIHDFESTPLDELMACAAAKRDAAHGRLVSYSRKVFIPLTKLCRDVCHYCTFAERPRAGRPAYLSAEAVLTIARAGAAAGCTEALFTLGDKPELRYRAAREALVALGHDTTISYLREMCALVLKQTGLLPHVNPGIMAREEIASLREVSASMGIMLESSSDRLCEPGGVHHGSPDKAPSVRLEMMRIAGEHAVPFTTGILIGIGET